MDRMPFNDSYSLNVYIKVHLSAYFSDGYTFTISRTAKITEAKGEIKQITKCHHIYKLNAQMTKFAPILPFALANRLKHCFSVALEK